ncbi:MAG: cytochrome c nitrite reductase small subunit [Anaerolineae bacterium]|nr:cytochrome c nitrite reductase small subunit [Anaerolineae bacterium]
MASQTPRSRARVLLPVMFILAGLFGAIVGLGGFTFIYAKGDSYLTDDPAACANCHVMRDVYTAWSRGSHRAVAGCNDCHTPHDNIVAKYAVKGINGFNHSLAFTTGNFHEPIRITSMNRDVALHNCQSCHAEVTAMINHSGNKEPLDCLKCHSRVGHDE